MYKIKKTILSFFAIINLLSCNNNNYQPFINLFSQTLNVELFPLNNISKDSIGNPTDILSFGKYIVLSEPQLDKLLSIYNIEDHTFQRIQKKGRGPQELIGISQINSINDSSFYAFDPFSNTIATYQIDCNIKNTTYRKLTEDVCNFFHEPTRSIYTQKGNYKFVLYDSILNITRQFGNSFKLPGHSSQIVSYLDGYSTISFHHNRIIWFSCCGDILELYDFNKIDSCKLIKREIGLLPIFKKMKVKNNEIPVFLPKTKLGVYSITSNKECIFILYNENYIKDEIKKKENAYLSDKILVYDWNGNPIHILKLNQKVSAISYNQYDRYFYCLSHNSELEPNIMKFKL